MQKTILLGVAIAIFSQSIEVGLAEQADFVINLWPNDPPGEKRTVGPEQDMTKDTDKRIAGRRIIKLGNVQTPQAHVYLPPINIRTGASVVICPGGGFSILAWELEGTEVAQWLTVQGAANMLLAMKKVGVPAELLIYDAGGHGYGLRSQHKLPVTLWNKPCEDWLRKAGWIFDSTNN